MIFSPVSKAFKTMAANPLVLLPVAVTVMAAQVINYFTGWVLERPLTDMVLYGNIFTEGDPLALFIANYPVEIIVMLVTGIIGMTFFAVSFVILSKVAGGKSFSNATDEGVKEIGKSFALVMAIFFALLALSGFAYLLTGIIAAVPLLALIIQAIIILIAAIIVFKLAFVFPALAEKKSTTKGAIAASWEFTNGKTIKTIFFFLLLCLVLFAFAFAANAATDLTGEAGETIITMVGEIIFTTFLGLALAYYYYS